MDENSSSNSKQIESVIASFRNFSPEKPIENAVIYFWESHTKLDDKARVQATTELIYKEFDLHVCEKYEVRTGYLSRYNYLPKALNECSQKEIEEAIIKGKEEQNNWLSICKPEFPEFKQKNWEECIFIDENRYFEQCKYLILEEIKSNKEFEKAVSDSVNEFASNHGTNVHNGNMYIVEELSWVLSLPLLHLNKPIFLIHVGSANSAVIASFHHFPNLKKSVKWLSPRFSETIFKNEAEFLLDYKNSPHLGFSYALENKESVRCIRQFKKGHILTRENLLYVLDHERAEKDILRAILGKLPEHVYWLSRDNIFLGCNEQQAKDLKLSSPAEILGKTNESFHTKKGADILNKINITVMETGIPYEGEELICLNDSSPRNCLTRKTPLFDAHGKVIGLLGISFDITDRKRAEQLETEKKLQNEREALRAKLLEKRRMYMGRIGHDIMSPLCLIKNILDYHKRKGKELGEEEYAELENRINKALDVAELICTEANEETIAKKLKIDVSAFVKETGTMPIKPILEDLIEQKRKEYQNKPVEFKCQIDDIKSLTIGNRLEFERTISNVINNAIEAHEDKPAIVEITLKEKEDRVILDIKDHGIGMPKEIVEKLLNFEGVSTTKSKGHGYGTQQIVESLQYFDATLDIDSIPGKGTTFSMGFVKKG